MFNLLRTRCFGCAHLSPKHSARPPLPVACAPASSGAEQLPCASALVAMADAPMADAEGAPSGSAAPAPTKKGKVDYAAIEADVQAHLQAAAQVRGCRSSVWRAASASGAQP